MIFLKAISVIKRISDLFRKLYGKYRFKISILVGIGFLAGFFEAFSVSILIPLFSFITSQQSVRDDLVSRIIASIFSFLHLEFKLTYLLALIIFLFLLKAVALVIFGYIQTKILADYECDSRIKLYDNAFNASWPHLLKQKIGYLEHFLMTRIGASSALLQRICTMILDTSTFLVYVFAAFSISSYTTISVLVLGAIILIFAKPVLSKTKIYVSNLATLSKKIANKVNENFLGMKNIKSMNAEGQIVEEGVDLFKKYRHARVKMALIKYLHAESIQPIGIVLICVVFLLSYSRSVGFDFAAFAVIVYLIQRIFSYIDRAGKWLHSVNDVIPQVTDLISFQEELNLNREEDNGRKRFVFNESLEFDNVDFNYNNEQSLFNKINFKIKKGEMIGIIGPSGVGKTTVVDLILRLFKPVGGKVLLDGQNIDEISMREWRDNISYVSQDIFLKNDTIANNIRFYNNKISNEDIVESAKSANIYNFIKDLPQGFETMVGERGMRFSGGERQRIVLARALARRPQILILDEATSALDNESESLIKKSIEELKRKMTIIVIAHRLSTVMSTDRLMVLEEGRIVEEGAPDDLLKDKQSFFYKVYNIK